MSKVNSSGSWIARLILVPPTFIFALIAARNIFHPVESAAAVGIALTTPLAFTILRIGFGAFPLGCSLFALSCLLSTRRILIGLEFVAIMMGVALVVRVFGMEIDGTVRESMKLVGAEAFFLALTLFGVFIESRRRRLELSAAR